MDIGETTPGIGGDYDAGTEEEAMKGIRALLFGDGVLPCQSFPVQSMSM